MKASPGGESEAPRRSRSGLGRLFGWVLVGLGVATMVVVTSTGYDDLRLLPGQHDVVYFAAAIAVAAAGTWWLGLFDRG